MHWSLAIGFNKNFFHHCLLKRGANVLSTIPMLTRQVSNGRRPSLFNFFNLLNCINNSGGGPKKEWILIIPFMTFLTRHEWMKILNVPASKPPLFVLFKQHLAKSNNLLYVCSGIRTRNAFEEGKNAEPYLDHHHHKTWMNFWEVFWLQNLKKYL